MLENRDGPGGTISHYVTRNSLDVLGYNNLALNIGIERLLKRSMIEVLYKEDQNGDRYSCYSVEASGISWLSDNYESLILSSSSKSRKSPRQGGSSSFFDDDIPF